MLPPEISAISRRKLSDAFIHSVALPGKYADGEVPGLYLEVTLSRKIGKPASKHWRLKYRLQGKENRFSIGSYPQVGLKDARERAISARREVAKNVAPLKAKIAKMSAIPAVFLPRCDCWLCYEKRPNAGPITWTNSAKKPKLPRRIATP